MSKLTKIITMNELYKKVKCSISNDHFIKEPKKLACGHNVCTDCINNFMELEIKCRHCGSISKKENLKKAEVNKEAKAVVITRLKTLFVDLNATMDEMLDKHDEGMQTVNGIK